MKLNLFEKILVGGYSIKIGKIYFGFPKLAPFMITAFVLSAFGQELFIPELFWSGVGMIGIGLISFFYFNLFPGRRPKNEEELKSFTIKIGK